MKRPLSIRIFNYRTCNKFPDKNATMLKVSQEREQKTLSLPNSARGTETAAATAAGSAPVSPLSSVLGLFDQPNLSKHGSSLGTSSQSQASVIESCAESQTTVQVLRTSTGKASSSTIAGFCDRVSPATQKELDASLAIYASGTPLTIIKNPFWINFFNKLRPAYKVPSSYVKSHTLLDRADG